jgi:subtilisin family serine protease
MKKIVKSNTYILLLTFFFLSCGLARGEGFLSISYWKHKIFVPGEILVKFKRWVPEKTKERVLRASGAFVIRPFPTLEIQHLGLPPSASVEEALRVYRQDPAVEYAEPNYIIHACQVFPNDPVFDPEHPYYGLLWGLYNFGQTVGGRSGLPGADINASDAWEVTRGGEGVIIAVIDTGVAYSHPDLAANMWTNPGEDPWLDPHDLTTGDGIDNDGNGYNDDWRGWDFVDGDNDPVDYHGHGTHVAGTIAAIGDNGKGITGVMWEAGIMPLRILNSHGMGAVSNAIRAIHYAVQKGARIINVSWGGGNYSQALYDAMASSDVLFVAAAGNDSLNTDSNPFYPASYDLPNIISVAATDPRDRLGSFSNWGPSTVDVAAPGATIYSTSPSTHSIGGTFPDNVESGPGNWTTGGTTPWAIVDTPYESPTHCWSDSPEDNYSNATDSWLILPTVDLSEKRLSRLTYYLRMETEVYRDFLYVEASIDGMNWTNIYGQGVGYSGSTGGAFVKISDDISGYDGEPTVHIRLRLVADPQHTFDGVYVDDVDIASISHTYDGDEFQFLQGTSMAAPHVSGLAGLLVSAYPALPLEELRWRILNGTDELGDLTEKVATGGRINASNSLRLPMAPSRLCASQASGTQIDLQWVDNSPDEEGFTVERRVRGGRYREITRVDPDTTAYSDTNPEGGAPYTYRVRAFNRYGNSGYSNEAWTANSGGGVAFTAGGGGSGSGGCFVATAAYGSPYHRRIDLLRAFRDEYLTDHPMGKKCVQLYYRYSPPVARFIADHPAMRKGVRIALSPFVALSAGIVSSPTSGEIPTLLTCLSLVSLIILLRRPKSHS